VLLGAGLAGLLSSGAGAGELAARRSREELELPAFGAFFVALGAEATFSRGALGALRLGASSRGALASATTDAFSGAAVLATDAGGGVVAWVALAAGFTG
jgi:hypothetical protein